MLHLVYHQTYVSERSYVPLFSRSITGLFQTHPPAITKAIDPQIAPNNGVKLVTGLKIELNELTPALAPPK